MAIVLYVLPSAGGPHPAELGKTLATHPLVALPWVLLPAVLVSAATGHAASPLSCLSSYLSTGTALLLLGDLAVISLLSGPLRASSTGPLSTAPALALLAWLQAVRTPLSWLATASWRSLASVAAVWLKAGHPDHSPVLAWMRASGGSPQPVSCWCSSLAMELLFAALLGRAILTATSFIPSLHVFAYRHAAVVALAFGIANVLVAHIASLF